MGRRKQVDLLIAKAAQDEYALRTFLNDPEAPVELFGFHAQQAAEKLLKAVLTACEVVYPLTHRLAELIDLAREHGINIVDEVDEARYLTPFAVEFRYDIFPLEPEEPVDKDEIYEQVMKLHSWALSTIETCCGDSIS